MKKLDKMVTIRVDEDTAVLLETLCENEVVNRSTLFRRMIKLYTYYLEEKSSRKDDTRTWSLDNFDNPFE
jgi:metal-responsive CopG/Arc/MetJ family transcriptional regulator